MAFTQSNLYRLENPGIRVTPSVYTYQTDDSIADVSSANYFCCNNPRYTLKALDIIMVQASDGFVILSIGQDGQSGTPTSNNPPNIVETSVNYQIQTSDDYVVGENEITVTLPPLASAVRPVSIRNVGILTITVDGNGASTEVSSITSGQGATLLPISTGWVVV